MLNRVEWLIKNGGNFKSSVDLYKLYDSYVAEYGYVAQSTFKRYCREAAQCIFDDLANISEKEQESTVLNRKTESKNNIALEMLTYDSQSPEELLKFANIDTNVWEIDKTVTSRWGNSTKPQYQLKCWLKRKRNLNLTDFSDIIDNLINSKNIIPSRVTSDRPTKRSNDTKLVEIGLADFHFGMKARVEETGKDIYDLATAEDLLVKCCNFFVEKIKDQNVDAILLPVLGDFFNCDYNNATTAGTPQDEDTTYKETFQRAQELAIYITNKFKKIAPVKWIICEGNHDKHKSFYFNEFLRAWFKDDENVTVDNSLIKKKFHMWKNNLFMYTHGDTEKLAELPLSLAQAKKEQFAKCDFYYIGVGHLHHKTNGIIRTSIDSNGMEVNILPSLVSSSKWEANKGYNHIKECVCNLYTKNGKEQTIYYHPPAQKNEVDF